MATYRRVTQQYRPQATQINVDPRYGKLLVMLIVCGVVLWLIWQLAGMPAASEKAVQESVEPVPTAQHTQPPAQPTAAPTVANIAQPLPEESTSLAYVGQATEERLYQYAMIYGPYALTVYGNSLTIGLGSEPLLVSLPREWAQWDRAARLNWILGVYAEQFGELP